MGWSMRGAQTLTTLCLTLFGTLTAAQTSIAPSQAPSFNLSVVVGNLTARETACNKYVLPSPYNNVTFDTSLVGPYLTARVGADTYNYHRFGPFNSAAKGNNLTVILIVGTTSTLPFGSNIWTPDLLQVLGRNREVITFDLPGAGSTSGTPSNYQSLDSISQSLLGFIQSLQLSGPPDILGYYWGGTIALHVGAFYGTSVRNLVIVSSTSGGEGYYPGQYLQSNASTPTSSLDALLFPNTIDGEDGLCKLNAFLPIMPNQTLTANDLMSQASIVNRTWSNNTLSASLGNIQNPTLLVAGELDVIVDFRSTLFLLENINQSVLLSTGGAGNGLLFQDTENVAPVIKEFLDYYDDYVYTYSDYGFEYGYNSTYYYDYVAPTSSP